MHRATRLGACVLSVVVAVGCSRTDKPREGEAAATGAAPAPGSGDSAGVADGSRDSELAKSQLEARDFPKARETLGRLVADKRATPEEHAQLSELHLAAKDRQAGEQALRQGLQRFPKHPYLTFRLGSYLAALTRYEEAVAVLREADALAPDDPKVLSTLSVAQARRGDHAAAAATAGRLYKHSAGRDAGVLYASQLEASGDAATAERIYRDVLAKDSDNLLVQNNLAILLADKGELREAERLARRAVEKSPKNGRILDTLGWVQYRGDKLTDAAQTLQRALTLAPEVGAVHYHHGLVLAALGKKDEARQAFREARRLEPSASWADEAARGAQ